MSSKQQLFNIILIGVTHNHFLDNIIGKILRVRVFFISHENYFDVTSSQL
jgi:hypothetical protein